MVGSARLGNKCVTSQSSDNHSCVYLYLADDNHFHIIFSLIGIFSSNYFWEQYLKNYDHREYRQSETSCIVCKERTFPQTEANGLSQFYTPFNVRYRWNEGGDIERGNTEIKWVDAIDPFDSVTIASVCMNVYGTKFLEEEWRVKDRGNRTGRGPDTLMVT